MSQKDVYALRCVLVMMKIACGLILILNAKPEY